MSSALLPPRARCIQVIDGNVTCQCPWFNAPSLPILDQVDSMSMRPVHSTLKSSQLSCVDCGHGIHAHVDYESKVVFHNPTTHCAAYAQKAHKSQACTCTVQLIDHEPTVNAYRSMALSLIARSPSSVTPSNANVSGPSGDTSTLAITSTLIPSINTIPSSDPNPMLYAPVPVPFHSNSVLHFSQSDAYAFVAHQQSDDASLVQDLAGGSAVHHATEGYYDYQGHSFETDGAPSAGPYA
ncbi:hypothetical protein EV421DRAFT_1902488 [Armillaria borealis]|uniref:Uncharacterized protein n=1 Tax=Armillaria borealis TaxID=47425 RepID=A0AA39MT08_9AGAR|nr:hypothetical protein EV421DRAFT_1902488 [Armillaria borealis]